MTVYLADGVRSPIGRFGGPLRPLRATQIATEVGAELLRRNAVPPSAVDLIIAGMVLQDMTESNPGRIVGMRLGVPDRVPAFTVNMQCCSGLQALILAGQRIALGEADCVLVLGMESMSNAPHMVAGARWGLRLTDAEFTDTLKECTLAGSRMWGDPWYMIDVAENHARVDGVSREEMDQYAVLSHSRAVAALDAGHLRDEIVPINVPARRGAAATVGTDDTPRRDISLEAHAQLPTERPGGTITAGNASSICDGAAAALVCSERGIRELGLQPIAKLPVSGTAVVGCDPRLMGYSCVAAAEAALRRAGLGVGAMDLIECNEGFAVQAVACVRLGRWPLDRVNVDGGSIGLGHPVGMSGLRIAVHLAHALRLRNLRVGIATVPAGSGLGAAAILERA
jgi:acetyl-CoA C-acetyltransferase